MCESDNKIIVLNRAGWINKDRILFYNYELQYKDNAPEKFCTREEMCKKYKLTRGSIHQLINDGKKGKDPSKRYKWKDFQIKAIHENSGCIIKDRVVVNSKGEVVVKKLRRNQQPRRGFRFVVTSCVNFNLYQNPLLI